MTSVARVFGVGVGLLLSLFALAELWYLGAQAGMALFALGMLVTGSLIISGALLCGSANVPDDALIDEPLDFTRRREGAAQRTSQAP